MSLHHQQQQQQMQQQQIQQQQLQQQHHHQQQQQQQHGPSNGDSGAGGMVMDASGLAGGSTGGLITSDLHSSLTAGNVVVTTSGAGSAGVAGSDCISVGVDELGGGGIVAVATSSTASTSSMTPVELQNLQMTDPAWPLRMWTNDMTYKLLEKVQRRKQMLLDPKLRRRMVYADVAQEFQDEGIPFSTSDIEKKYTSLLSTYRRNMDRKKGSTWQYYHILEDIYSEIGPDGRKVHLSTSNLNPQPPQSSPTHHTPPRQEIRQSKRMRTRPARLKGHVDYTDGATASCRFDTDFYAAESIEKVRELMNDRLDELQSQRDAAFLASKKAWGEVKEGLDAMNDNIQTLNSSVVMLAHTVSNVLNGLNKMKK